MLELKTDDVDPRDLISGQILCGDDGVPFAIVATRPDIYTSGAVMVPTLEIPAGPFDVRTFSNDHRYMRTNGCAGVSVWPTYAHAWADRERSMERRTAEEVRVWRQYSAMYYADTLRLVRREEFPAGLSVEFPAGTTAKVVVF